MRVLNFESKMGRLAREIEEASFQGREVDIAYLHDKLNSEFSRKQISDWASNLTKRGYLEKLGTGKYRASRKLHDLAGRESKEPSAETRKTERIIIRKKSPEKAVRTGEERHEVDLTRFINLVQRLEACLDRLESITARFYDQAELEKAVSVMEKALVRFRT